MEDLKISSQINTIQSFRANSCVTGCQKTMDNCPRGVSSRRLLFPKKLHEQQNTGKVVCVLDILQNVSNDTD